MKLIRCERCDAEITARTILVVQSKWRDHNRLVHPGVIVHRAAVEDVAG